MTGKSKPQAKLPKAIRGAPLRGADRPPAAALLAEMYKDGASIRWIAIRLERSYGYVYDMLVLSGTPIRPKGRQKGTTAKVIESGGGAVGPRNWAGE